jgi:sigma-E factor negative regulatory protein RseA
MSDKLKENMSALVDGELEFQSASETIDMLLDDEALQVHWSRYHVVRDVLRHKAYPDAGEDLCERVRGCLADEPLHFPDRRRSAQRWRSALKPVAGVALAASVAGFAVLAVRGAGPLGGKPDSVAVPAARVATSTPLVGEGTTPAVSAAPRLVQAEVPARGLRRLQWTPSEPGVADRLNGYLVNHSEYLGGAMKGMHPYARIVGYDSTGQR